MLTSVGAVLLTYGVRFPVRSEGDEATTGGCGGGRAGEAGARGRGGSRRRRRRERDCRPGRARPCRHAARPAAAAG